jgi:hypothetical protein
MKLHHVVIAIIIVSMIALGSIDYLTDLGENYGETADLSGLNNTQARLETQQENAQELSDEVTSFKLESVTDFISIPYKMIKIGWKMAKTMFSSWTTVGTMVTETGDQVSETGIPLPGWLVPSIIALIVITLIAILVYGFFKWKFED